MLFNSWIYGAFLALTCIVYWPPCHHRERGSGVSIKGGIPTKWRFVNRVPGSFGGLNRLDLTLRHGELRLKATARERDLSGANAAHLGVTLRVGTGAGADCWSALARSCASLRAGDTLRCR